MNAKNATATQVLGPKDGEITGHPEFCLDRYMIDGAETDGRVSLVEQTLAPKALAAPLHIHSREDEYLYVIEGRLGARLGDEEVGAEVGDLVFLPRGQWHTFWNPQSDAPTRAHMIITPAGLEELFRQLGNDQLDPETLPALAAQYGCELDLEGTGALIERHGLKF